MRAGTTRVAAYSSKLLRNVPRWRRSKASTAPSCVRPANALSTTVREIPAAAASRDMAERKALKSPPHVAALAGGAKKRAQNRIKIDRTSSALPGSARNAEQVKNVRLLPVFLPKTGRFSKKNRETIENKRRSP
jgi:hypothetical protein